MTTKTNIAAALPSAMQTVLLVLATIVSLYGAFYPMIAPLIPASAAATLGGIVLFVTAVVQRGPQLQELAGDIAAGQPLTEIIGDLRDVIEGNTAATQANTAQTAVAASMAAAQACPDPLPPQPASAAPAPSVDNTGGA